VRSSVDKGVDSIVQQSETRPTTTGDAGAVPDDVHSAFGDESDEPGTPPPTS
jgi:hypothetical protein